ncbi:MAG: tripartite tricarboxylate transporter TctB family protein [Casimicrobiaceae bacterium]
MPEESQTAERGVSTRSVEIAVAIIIFLLGALVVFDSYRLGSKWGSDGPQSGYFPFYIGLLLCISSAVILGQAVRKVAVESDIFVTWGPLKLVMTVLIPAVVYVLAVQWIGLYIASAIYITVFMVWLGHYSWLRSLVVGFGVNVAFFFMFEVWFKVPLFKGELNPLGFLGY